MPSLSISGHITSYLLRLGADPDLPDSSGNTAVHYAAAYGWYFCLKLLGQAGANMNAANAWQLTPLAVAYLKGHMGLADFLLEGNWENPVDINCKVRLNKFQK
jgi:ankyrin repeat protein